MAYFKLDSSEQEIIQAFHNLYDDKIESARKKVIEQARSEFEQRLANIIMDIGPKFESQVNVIKGNREIELLFHLKKDE